MKSEIANYYHWFNEPDNVSIRISQEFREKMFKISLEKAKSMTNLSKFTGLSKQTLFNQKYGKSMNVKGLKKLLLFSDIKFTEVYGHIQEMGWNKFKLPIKLDGEEGAVVFAAILGDGSNTTRVMYKNKDQALLNKVEKSFKDLLGDAIVDKRISSTGIPYMNFPRITGRILNFVGIPSGKQMIFNPEIPKVVKFAEKNVKRAFIQQFFDDEGWPEPDQMKVAASQCADVTVVLNKEFIDSIKGKKVIYLKDIPLEVRKEIEAPRLLIDLKDILKEDFDIDSNIRFKRLLVRKNHITGAFELEIYRKDDVKKFFEEINFYSPVKRKKLEFMINRSRNFPPNIMLLIINESIKLSKNKEYFLACEIAKSLNFSQPAIRKRLSTLVKKGVFDKKGEKYFMKIEF
ncbi:MAG: hypothetical protein Q8R47_01885 [Nanoarchaeota archaeon]|nr:hypothetical protein [Nanoarchaeota archaeon]